MGNVSSEKDAADWLRRLLSAIAGMTMGRYHHHSHQSKQHPHHHQQPPDLQHP